MADLVASVSFTAVAYNVGGAQTLTVAVQTGDVLSGYLNYFPNVSGGTAAVTFTYWQNGKPTGEEASLEITSTERPGNQITVPAGVDMAVMSFGNVTFPSGSVTIELTRP